MIHNELGVPGYQWDGELDMIGHRALFLRQRRAERIVHGSNAIEHSGGTQAQAPELSLLEEPESAAVIAEGNFTDDHIRSSELEAEVEVEHEAEAEAESGAESEAGAEEAEEPRAESDVSTENEPHSHEEKDVEEEEEGEQRELPVLESHMSRRLAVQLEEVLSRADEGVVMTAATKITTATTTANVAAAAAAAADNKDDDTVTVIAIAAGGGSSFLSEDVRAAKSADEENEGPFRLERTDETMSFQDVSSLSSHPSFSESLPRNALKQSASKLAMLRAEESWLESSIRDRIAYLSRR
jgi:hypothetical protein